MKKGEKQGMRAMGNHCRNHKRTPARVWKVGRTVHIASVLPRCA